MASAGLCHTSAKLERPRLEVADIFRAHAEQYRESHALSLQQLKLLWDIENCRTAALGGHADVCIACGHYTISFNFYRSGADKKPGGISSVPRSLTWRSVTQ